MAKLSRLVMFLIAYVILLSSCLPSQKNIKNVEVTVTSDSKPILASIMSPTQTPSSTKSCRSTSPSTATTNTTDRVVQTPRVVSYNEAHWTFYALDEHMPEVLKTQGAPNSISSIAFSQDGIAWVGTYGLWKYQDGNWSVFLKKDGMREDNVEAVAAAPNGDDVWVGANGISHFNGETWQTYVISDVHDIEVAPDGTLWVAHPPSHIRIGVSYFDGKSWETIAIGEETQNQANAWSLAITPEGVIWFGTDYDGIYKLENKAWTHYPLSDFPKAGAYSSSVRDIIVAPDRTIWAVMLSVGVLHYDGNSWSIYPYASKDGGLKAIAVSEAGRVWVGEVFGNVVAFMENGQWYTFDSLPFDKVYDIQIAPNGAAWFATGDGLYIYQE